MPRNGLSKSDKIEHPQSHYATPDELIEDRALSVDEKVEALKICAQDARQMLRGQVERAGDNLQRSSKRTASRRGE